MGLADFQADVVDDEIVISLRGTSYVVTYYKPDNSLQLLAKRLPDRIDPRARMTQATFLAQAWRLANDMARELKWIV
jgi:hypothetical protein